MRWPRWTRGRGWTALALLLLILLGVVPTLGWLTAGLPIGDFPGYMVWAWFARQSPASPLLPPSWSRFWMAGAPFDSLVSPLVSSLGGLLAGFLDLNAALKVEIVAFFVAAGPSMFWFMRRIRVGRRAAFIAAAVYLLSPFHLLQAGFYTHIDQTAMIAIVPLQLGAFEGLLRRGRFVDLVLATFSVAVLFPLYSEYAFAVGTLLVFVSIGLAVFRARPAPPVGKARPRLPRSVLIDALQNVWRVAVVGILACVIASFWLVPSLLDVRYHVLLPDRFLQSSVLMNPVLFIDRGGIFLRPYALPGAFDPVSALPYPGFAYSAGYYYVGVVLMALIVLARLLLRRKPSLLSPEERTWYRTFLWAVPLGVAAWTLQDFGVLQAVIPFLGYLRSSYLFFLVSYVALAVLSGYSFLILERALAPGGGGRSEAPHEVRVAVPPESRVRFLQDPRVLVILVAVLLVADYAAAWQAFDTQLPPALVGEFQTPPPAGPLAPYRVAGSREAEPQYDLAITQGERQLGTWTWWSASRDFGTLWVDDILPRLQAGTDLTNLSLVLGVSNVRYVREFHPSLLADRIAADASGPFRIVASDARLVLAENLNWRPYVQVYAYCDPTTGSSSPFSDLATAARRGEVVGGTLCSLGSLPRSPTGTNGTQLNYSAGIVAWEWPAQGELTIQVSLPRTSVVMVSEAYYPNWEATVDGRAASLAEVNFAFQGLLVGPGNHTITMRYVTPASHVAGNVASALATLVLLGCLALPAAYREKILRGLRVARKDSGL